MPMRLFTRRSLHQFAAWSLASVACSGALAQIGDGAERADGVAGAAMRLVERAGHTQFTGRLLVRPAQTPGEDLQPGEEALRSAQARARLQTQGMTVLRYIPETDEYLVQVGDEAVLQAFAVGHPQRGERENARAAWLLGTGDYEYAHPDWLCFPTVNPNDPLFGNQWHLPQVRAPQAWDLQTGTNSVVIAIVDSGVDLDHPDLAGSLVPGYSSADGRTQASGGLVDDINGHGTACAGTAAARGNNSVGVSGAGWNFRIMPVRCSTNTDGSAPSSAILDGARWAASNGARVVSASFTGVSSPSVNSTGTFVKSRNALFLYAADNSNTNWSGFSWPDVIVVGATSFGDAKAGFSSFGNGVSVFAPGVSIFTTFIGGGYGSTSGTSFATPLTAGVVGLIMSANPGLTAQQVQDLLYSTTDRLGNTSLVYPQRDAVFGFGRVNAQRAVQGAISLIGSPTINPDVTASVLGTARSIDVLANDVDLSQLGLTITAFDATGTSGGTITRLAGAGPNGRDVLRYTAPATLAAGAQGPIVDTFTYTARNAVNASATATVQVSLVRADDFIEDVSLNTSIAGVRGSYFDLAELAPLNQLPSFADASLVATRVERVANAFFSSTGLAGTGLSANSGAVLRGYIQANADDIYQFFVRSSDGSRLYIDDRLVVENDGLHPMFEASGLVPLRAGWHSFRVEYFAGAGDTTGKSVSLNYASLGALNTPAFARRTIPATAFRIESCRADLNRDNVVDNADFAIFALAYNAFASFEGDLNDDARTDSNDFVIFADAYGDLLCP